MNFSRGRINGKSSANVNRAAWPADGTTDSPPFAYKKRHIRQKVSIRLDIEKLADAMHENGSFINVDSIEQSTHFD